MTMMMMMKCVPHESDEEDVGSFIMRSNRNTNSVTLNPKTKHKFSLIWLHGMGQNAHGPKSQFYDYNLPIVPPTCKVIIPTAPTRKSTASGQTGPSWFDVLSMQSSPNMSLTQKR